MSVKIAKIENPLVCSHCGSPLVQQKIWIDANTIQPVPVGKVPVLQEDCWCTNCEDSHLLIHLDEYKEKQEE